MGSTKHRSPSLAAGEHEAVIRSFLETVFSGADLAQVVRCAIEDSCRLLGLDVAWVYLFDDETREPLLAATTEMPPMFGEQPERWDGLCGCIHALYNNDTEPFGEVPELYRCSRMMGVADGNPSELQYHVCIPLIIRNETLGIINVATSDWRPVPRAVAAALHDLARLLSLAVERDRLLKSKRAVRAERERIARELHDTLLQGLTGIALQLETADALRESGAETRSPLLRALELTQETMAETRAAIEDLGAVSLGSATLSAVLTKLVEDFAHDTGCSVALDLSLGMKRMPAPVETAVVRIAREGLQNVVRHAAAKNVRLKGRRLKGRLSLILVDDGRGFDAARVAASFHGYGLASMRRRVQLLGGRFRLVTAPGRGTRVEMSIPVD